MQKSYIMTLYISFLVARVMRCSWKMMYTIEFLFVYIFLLARHITVVTRKLKSHDVTSVCTSQLTNVLTRISCHH